MKDDSKKPKIKLTKLKSKTSPIQKGKKKSENGGMTWVG